MYHHDGILIRELFILIINDQYLHYFVLFSIINPAKAINELGWKPRHVGFVEEIDIYYKSWAAHKAAQEATPSSKA